MTADEWRGPRGRIGGWNVFGAEEEGREGRRECMERLKCIAVNIQDIYGAQYVFI